MRLCSGSHIDASSLSHLRPAPPRSCWRGPGGASETVSLLPVSNDGSRPTWLYSESPEIMIKSVSRYRQVIGCCVFTANENVGSDSIYPRRLRNIIVNCEESRARLIRPGFICSLNDSSFSPASKETYSGSSRFNTQISGRTQSKPRQKTE